MSAFYDFIYMLKGAGIVDVMLPFALIFTLIFAILQKTKILGVHYKSDGSLDEKNPRTNLNVMVAIAMGFAFIVPHVLGYYPANKDPVIIIQNSLASVSVVLIAAVMVLLVVGLVFGKKMTMENTSGTTKILTWVFILITVYIFGSNMGWFPWFFQITRTTQTAIVAIAIFFIIVRFVMGSGEKKKKKPNKHSLSHLMRNEKDYQKWLKDEAARLNNKK